MGKAEAVMDPGNEEFSILLLQTQGFKVSLCLCHRGWGSAVAVMAGLICWEKWDVALNL